MTSPAEIDGSQEIVCTGSGFGDSGNDVKGVIMFRRILQTFQQAIFPSKCIACRRLFHPPSQGATEKLLLNQRLHDPMEAIFDRIMAPFLCPECRTDFSPIQPPFCSRCGRMFKTKTGDSHQCGNCIQHPPVCRTTRAAGIYSGTLKSIIHALKYSNKVHLARVLGQLLFTSFIRYYNSQPVDIIIPVPLHASRLRQRGFNQAEMLIDEWPAIFGGIDAQPAIPIDEKILVRQRNTLSQTGLGREKRKHNVRGAFAVSDRTDVVGKHVLLIDDVYTTGSTSNECARALIKGGAADVSVLTLARAE